MAVGLLLMLGCLWGCPSSEQETEETAEAVVSAEWEEISVIVRYQVSATMENSNGEVYETVHAATFESPTTSFYDEASKEYVCGDFVVEFGAAGVQVNSIEDPKTSISIPAIVKRVAGLKLDRSDWPAKTVRKDEFVAEGISFSHVDPEYSFFDGYYVYRLTNPCGSISQLACSRSQETPSAADPTKMETFNTWLSRYSCTAESYIEVAIRDPRFGKR